MTIQQILIFILVVTGIICLLMAAGQLLLKRRTLRNYILAAMFGCIAICLFASAAYYSHLILRFPHLFMISIPFLFLCMPMFYLFLKIWAHEEFIWGKREYLHIIPGVFVFLSLLPVYLLPAENKLSQIHQRLSPGHYSMEDIYFILGLIHNLLYMGVFLNKTRVQNFVGHIKEKWSVVLFISGQVILFATITLLITAAILKNPEIDIIGMAGISVVLTITYVLMLRNPEFIFELREVLSKTATKYRKSRIKNMDVDDFRKRLYEMLEVRKIYHDPELTLAGFAAMLSVKTHVLSEFLNKIEQKKYHELLNEYRVKEAKSLLLDEKDEAVYSIGYRVGFPSRSSFNSAFSKFTGCSPTSYRRERGFSN
jgi:AraC-like DNA-binding protein